MQSGIGGKGLTPRSLRPQRRRNGREKARKDAKGAGIGRGGSAAEIAEIAEKAFTTKAPRVTKGHEEIRLAAEDAQSAENRVLAAKRLEKTQKGRESGSGARSQRSERGAEGLDVLVDLAAFGFDKIEQVGGAARVDLFLAVGIDGLEVEALRFDRLAIDGP